jgi:hypothetical protein
MLPTIDLDYLHVCFPGHSIVSETGMVCVLIPGFQLPAGLSIFSADLLFRLSPGYPDVPPDMWWFSPAIHRQNGVVIPATEVTERHLQRSWQRWSRHLPPGQWRSGVDSLESYLTLVRRELDVAAGRIAA